VGLPTQASPPLLLVEEKSRRLCSCWKHPHSTLAVARCCLVPPCFDKSLSASVYLLSALFLTHTYTAATGSNVWVCRSSACALRFVLQSVASRDSETFPLVMSEEWWVRRWEKLGAIRHVIGHFTDESFQIIDFTAILTTKLQSGPKKWAPDELSINRI